MKIEHSKHLSLVHYNALNRFAFNGELNKLTLTALIFHPLPFKRKRMPKTASIEQALLKDQLIKQIQIKHGTPSNHVMLIENDTNIQNPIICFKHKKIE